MTSWLQAMNSGRLVMVRCLGEFHRSASRFHSHDGSRVVILAGSRPSNTCVVCKHDKQKPGSSRVWSPWRFRCPVSSTSLQAGSWWKRKEYWEKMQPVLTFASCVAFSALRNAANRRTITQKKQCSLALQIRSSLRRVPGWFHSLAVTSMGEVWAWGQNKQGQALQTNVSNCRELQSVASRSKFSSCWEICA